MGGPGNFKSRLRDIQISSNNCRDIPNIEQLLRAIIVRVFGHSLIFGPNFGLKLLVGFGLMFSGLACTCRPIYNSFMIRHYCVYTERLSRSGTNLQLCINEFLHRETRFGSLQASSDRFSLLVLRRNLSNFIE